MKRSIFVFLSVLFALGPAAVPGESHEEQKYTAQRRPRVTVMQFRDTNTSADETQYGESVSAMLVTYLKRKSQFVVVERQDVQNVLTEWQRIQEGQTEQNLSNIEIALLQRIDVIIQGSVTVLGNRIEIDGKLLSREDGRIITAAERSGPIDCLRQIVDRLGIALENSFLTPYYGKVQLTVYEPENVHFLLTPILTPDALDEEKPPGELDTTIFPGEDRDRVVKWTANPATHMIENVLAGWYTLRLKREGYEEVAIPNALLRAVETSKGFEVRYHRDRRMIPLSQAPEAERFEQLLVRVDSLATHEIDLSERGVEMRKKRGALDVAVLDENKEPIPGARVLMRSVALEINPKYQETLREYLEKIEAPRAEGESEASSNEKTVAEEGAGRKGTAEGDADRRADDKKDAGEDDALKRALYKSLDIVGKSLDQRTDKGSAEEEEEEAVTCEYFEEYRPPAFDYGRKTVSVGESFDLEDFKGGELYFEAYHGEIVPVGMYELAVWAPRQQLQRQIVMVAESSEEGKSRKVELQRRRKEVVIVGRSASKIRFKGMETGLEKEYGLDAETGLRWVLLPEDFYEMESGAEDLGAWRRQLDLRPASEEEPPSLEEAFTEADPPPSGGDESQESFSYSQVEVRVKTTVWVGGRYRGFRPFPHTFYNPIVSDILDEILEGTSVYDWSSLDADDDKLAALADHLRDIDLLILDEDDMSRIRVFPELADVIRSWVEDGHALLAFVTRAGDYQNVLGKPLSLKRRFSNSDRVRLNFEAGHPKFDYDVDLGWGRPLPKLKTKKLAASTDWNVVSYTKKQKKPRVIESGSFGEGGYVMVWFETSKAEALWQTFLGDKSGLGKIAGYVLRFFVGIASGNPALSLIGQDDDSAAKEVKEATEAVDEIRDGKVGVEETVRIAEAVWEARVANDQISLAKAQLQRQALLWAEYLMYRRLDGGSGKAGEYRTKIEQFGLE